MYKCITWYILGYSLVNNIGTEAMVPGDAIVTGIFVGNYWILLNIVTPLVWKCFSEINSAGKKTLKCNLCCLELAYAGGSTGTMTFKHNSTSLTAKECHGGQALKQACIMAYRSPVMSAMSKAKYQRCTQKLAAMCARDLRPLSIVKGIGFKELCNE